MSEEENKMSTLFPNTKLRQSSIVRPLSECLVFASFAMLTAAVPSGASQEDAQVDLGEPTMQSSAPSERQVFYGDLHIHTRNSFDAYIFSVRATPDDAYRFAKGEPIRHPSGYDMQISGGPLDFYAVTDHAEYLGVLPAMHTPGHPLSKLPQASDMFSTEPAKILAAFRGVGLSVRSGEPIEELYDNELIDSVWQQTIDAANKHNEPGVFTTFAAYEYTATSPSPAPGVGAGNLHRNVFFRDEAPPAFFSTLDSVNPEDLWEWMDSQRALGFDTLAIPHNSNVSDGQMFKLETYGGTSLTRSYAEQRVRNEPLVEVTQVKGTSETHPLLSPNDEWAAFEIFETKLATEIRSNTSGGYVREAYKRGLQLQDSIGSDPFKFGLVGASDSHVVGGAYAENNYWSKIGIVDGTPVQRGSVPLPGTSGWDDQPDTPPVRSATYTYSRWSASGLTGVWSEENTRDSIFAALRRKETFATSGPRIKLRFFGGYGFSKQLLSDPKLVATAYGDGVPMGGDLLSTGENPTFIVWAQRDAASAPLQRAQIIKVTAEDEIVFDVACSEGKPDSNTHRCPRNGASVDISDCSLLGAGAAELKTVWSDPEFKADEHATYYVRVLENPSCRWSTWDALRAGTPPRPGLPRTLQERAFSSPIWYTPAA